MKENAIELSRRITDNPSILKNRFTEISRLKKEFIHESMLDFGIGADTSIIDNDIIHKAQEAMNDKKNWNYQETGNEEYKCCYKQYLSKQLGYNFDSLDLALTMGIKQCLNVLALMLVDEGDLIITTTPNYNVFPRAVELLKGETLYLPINEKNNYFPDFDMLPEEVLKRAKVIHLNYPNNPTGAVLKKENILKLVDIANRYDITIINDAAYCDFNYTNEPKSIFDTGFNEHFIELYSASKSFGMLGARMGAIVSSSSFINNYNKFKDQTDSGGFYPLNFAHGFAMDCDIVYKNKEKYLKRSKQFKEILDKLHLRYKPFEATFYFFVETPSYFNHIKINSSMELSKILIEQYKIVTIPIDEVSRHLRFSLTYFDEKAPQKMYERLKDVIIEY